MILTQSNTQSHIKGNRAILISLLLRVTSQLGLGGIFVVFNIQLLFQDKY